MSINDNSVGEQRAVGGAAESSKERVKEDVLEAVAFAGRTLAPLYLYDPSRESELVMPLIAQLAALNCEEAAGDWPFVTKEDALIAFKLMHDAVDDESSCCDLKENLTWEYRRLFVGPNLLEAPPQGSVYTDRECVIFGASCLNLRKWMRQNRIGLEENQNEPEDHIGLLLSLMAYIASERPELLSEFLQEHLLTWSSHYLEQFYCAARVDFYQGVAYLTNCTLAGIQEELDLKVEVPRFYR